MGLKVTGTEIIGLVPKRVLVEAGRFFRVKSGLSLDIPETDLMEVAISAMNLNELRAFDLESKVI